MKPNGSNRPPEHTTALIPKDLLQLSESGAVLGGRLGLGVAQGYRDCFLLTQLLRLAIGAFGCRYDLRYGPECQNAASAFSTARITPLDLLRAVASRPFLLA